METPHRFWPPPARSLSPASQHTHPEAHRQKHPVCRSQQRGITAASLVKLHAEQPPGSELPDASAAILDAPPAAADEAAMDAADQNSIWSTTAAAAPEEAAHLAAEPTPAVITTDQPDDTFPAGEAAAAWAPAAETNKQQTPAADSGVDGIDVQVPGASAPEDMPSAMPEPAKPLPVWTTAAVRLSE